MFDARETMDEWEFERAGRTFRARVVPDHHNGAPWDEECGHGPVTDWTTCAKRPGQMVLCEDRGSSRRFYDFQEAVRIARRDGWGWVPGGAPKLTFRTPGDAKGGGIAEAGAYRVEADDLNDAIRGLYDAVRRDMGPRRVAAIAAWADFVRLRDWCDGRWCWVGVIVEARCERCGEWSEDRCERCGEWSEDRSLWGINSDAGDYLREVAEELADDLLHDEGEV